MPMRLCRNLQCASFTIYGLRGERVDVVWSKAWNELIAAAMSPTASQQYIRDLMKESGS
jgi:hypothetical protein